MKLGAESTILFQFEEGKLALSRVLSLLRCSLRSPASDTATKRYLRLGNISDRENTIIPKIYEARTHSVQHLCQSQGVLPWLRDALPLVFARDALIAVADLWLDARWCVAPPEAGLAVVWEGGPIVV